MTVQHCHVKRSGKSLELQCTACRNCRAVFFRVLRAESGLKSFFGSLQPRDQAKDQFQSFRSKFSLLDFNTITLRVVERICFLVTTRERMVTTRERISTTFASSQENIPQFRIIFILIISLYKQCTGPLRRNQVLITLKN